MNWTALLKLRASVLITFCAFSSGSRGQLRINFFFERVCGGRPFVCERKKRESWTLRWTAGSKTFRISNRAFRAGIWKVPEGVSFG